MQIKLNKTSITIEIDMIYTSRLINARLISLNVKVDGTIQDLLAKCEKISSLNDDMYRELSRISQDNG